MNISKRSVLTVGIVTIILSTWWATAYYTEPKTTTISFVVGQEGGVLYPDNYPICKPNLELIFTGWNDFKKICEYYGYPPSEEVVGLTITTPDPKLSIIYMPYPKAVDHKSKIDDWALFQLILGHEMMHVMKRQDVNYNKMLPNPDRIKYEVDSRGILIMLK